MDGYPPCLITGLYWPNLIDQWVIDDEFDAEETADNMPFFFKILGPMGVGSKTQSLNLKPQVLGCLVQFGERYGLGSPRFHHDW